MADSGFIQKLGIPLEEISTTSPADIWPVKFEKHGLKKVLDSDVHKQKLVMYTAIRDPISRLISAYKDKIGKSQKYGPFLRFQPVVEKCIGVKNLILDFYTHAVSNNR